MDNRILQILQNPDLLVLNDIEILENEVSKYPFVQSYKAIQLLATHRFKKENYGEKLSQTAAFTTDKKILYQLIHQKKIEKNKFENNILIEKESLSKLEKLVALAETKFQEVEFKTIDLPKEVYVDGELNRILLEGEEKILNEEKQSIDLETTQESKQIVIASKDGNAGEFAENTRKLTTETIIEEDKIKSEEAIIESGPELSFHGETEFLPNIKIVVKNENVPHFIPQNKVSKQEAEMQKLIAEVEAKIKTSFTKKVEKEDDFQNNYDLNFTGISHEENDFVSEKIEENSKAEIQKKEIDSTWKPIDFKEKKSTFRDTEILKKIELTVETEAESEGKPDEIQADLNQSVNLKEEIFINSKTEEKVEETPSDKDLSNVPVFINTWQTWLKLSPETPILKENTKQIAIEKFIEKEPKISKLKEENSFVVKDKGDNISHLMTETLANLYLDQKLYSKAEKAFELLIEKEPEKSDKFKYKLLKIKDLKNLK